MSKNVKCCIIGKQKVGKTRFFDVYFERKVNAYTPTVGVDFLKINNMVIWDTSGENRFVTVTRNFVLSSTILFCLYSDFDSYTWINNYMKSLDFILKHKFHWIVFHICSVWAYMVSVS